MLENDYRKEEQNSLEELSKYGISTDSYSNGVKNVKALNDIRSNSEKLEFEKKDAVEKNKIENRKIDAQIENNRREYHLKEEQQKFEQEQRQIEEENRHKEETHRMILDTAKSVTLGLITIGIVYATLDTEKDGVVPSILNTILNIPSRVTRL